MTGPCAFVEDVDRLEARSRPHDVAGIAWRRLEPARVQEASDVARTAVGGEQVDVRAPELSAAPEDRSLPELGRQVPQELTCCGLAHRRGDATSGSAASGAGACSYPLTAQGCRPLHSST